MYFYGHVVRRQNILRLGSLRGSGVCPLLQRLLLSQKDLYITYSRTDTRSRCHVHESEVKGVKRGVQAVRKDNLNLWDRSTSQNTEIFLFVPPFYHNCWSSRNLIG